VTLTKVGVADAPARRIDEVGIAELPLSAATVTDLLPPRLDRRIPHVFKEAAGAREGRLGEAISCVACGYGEAGHPALTAPEQEVVTTLMNQKQAPPFLRRSILRKLTSRLRIG